jgi:hypothetical protein
MLAVSNKQCTYADFKLINRKYPYVREGMQMEDTK